MKKTMYLLVAAFVMFWTLTAYAADAAPTMQDMLTPPVSPVVILPPLPPTEADVIAIFPNAAKVDGVGVYLFRAQSVGVGPSYTVARLWKLVDADIQFASITKGGSYVGVAGSVNFVDLVRQAGQTPPDLMITFNPSIGLTGGWVTGIAGKTQSGWDGGLRAKFVNLDTAKVWAAARGLLGL